MLTLTLPLSRTRALTLIITLPPRQVQLVLVDDGSSSVAAHAVLNQVERWREFAPSVPRRRRWLLLRQPISRYLGAGRNVAARAAAGEFLFFLDDDNCIKPHALATLVRASRLTGAHVLTSLNEKWPSRQRPPKELAPTRTRTRTRSPTLALTPTLSLTLALSPDPNPNPHPWPNPNPIPIPNPNPNRNPT